MNKIKELVKEFNNKYIFNNYNKQFDINSDKKKLQVINDKNILDNLSKLTNYSDKDNIIKLYKKQQQNKIKGLYTGLLKYNHSNKEKREEKLIDNLENESLTKKKIVKILMLYDEKKNKLILKLIVIFIFLVFFMILLIFLKLFNFRNYIILLTCFVVISIICIYLIKLIIINN